MTQYDKPSYWRRKAKQTEKVFKKRQWKAAKEAWAEYEIGDTKEGSMESTGERVTYSRVFPIFWSSVKTLHPAYYSKTPIPVAPIRYGINDPDARTGAKLLERLGIYALETTPFDEAMRDVSLEYIIGDICTTRVMLEGERKTNPIPVVAEEGTGRYLKEDGSEYTGQNIGEGENGETYGEEEYWEDRKCYLMALTYDQFMWTPSASCGDEIEEMFFRFCYQEHEAYEMFPGVDPDALKSAMKTYGKEGEDKEERKGDEEDQELYLHGWEIWHKPTKTVRFVSEDFKEGFLKSSPDPYGLIGFFPAPTPLVGTKQRGTLFGIPGYRYLAPMCEQMHDIMMRIYSLSQEARIRFVADGAYKEEIEASVESDEGVFIFIETMMDIVEKGGIQNVIQSLPVGELASSMQQLANVHALFKQEFYELYGVPDVVRGVSDPLETAKAQEIKNFNASNRFRDQMNKIAALARDSLELLVDLMLGTYEPEEILKITGAKYLDEAKTPEGQQQISRAYQLIASDEERMIRLDIETDSTSYINEMIQQQNLNVTLQTVTAGLQAINGMPPMQQAVGFKSIQAALAGQRIGKEFMDDIDQLMNQMMEAAKQPPPPPPPDVEMLKLEEMKNKNQLDAQVKIAQIQSSQIGEQVKAMSAQAEAEAKQRELEQKEFKLTLEAQKQSAEQQIEEAKLMIQQMQDDFARRLEEEYVAIEKFKAATQAQESMREEDRLAMEQELELVRVAMAEATKAEPVQLQLPEINLNVTSGGSDD